MLRELKNAYWARRLSFFGWRYDYIVAKKVRDAGLRKSRWRRYEAAQRIAPTHFLSSEGRRYWWFEDSFYWEDENLCAEDVLALIRDRERRQRRKLERARAAMATDGEPSKRRQPIAREVRLAVFERDAGRCVQCDSNFDLQYDHIIPVSMGGATTTENLQLLCSRCNQQKGGTLG